MRETISKVLALTLFYTLSFPAVPCYSKDNHTLSAPGASALLNDLNLDKVLTGSKSKVIFNSRRSELDYPVFYDSMAVLEWLVESYGDDGLKTYFRGVIERNSAKSLNVEISQDLNTDILRLVGETGGIQNILLSEEYYAKTLKDYNDSSSKLMALLRTAVRLFHVFGHTKFNSLQQYSKEEYDLFKMDVKILNILRSKMANAEQLYPEDTVKLLKLMDNSSVIADFDELIGEVEALESEAEHVYKNRDAKNVEGKHIYNIDEDKEGETCKLRDERIERAFVVGDPDYFADNPVKNILANPDIEGTFLAFYLEFLTQRAVSRGRESFFFLARDPLSVVPFNQLKNPRVPPNTKGVLVDMTTDDGKALENRRWARQYYALHKGRRFCDGIGVMEAENGRGMQQRWHQHETTQEYTTSICDNTQFRVARELTDDDGGTEIIEGVEVVKGGDDKGKEVVDAEDKGRKMKLVVIREETVPFGHMIAMPAKTFHTLRNLSSDSPSVDFTVKDPVTQIIKTFSPPDEKKLSEPSIISPQISDKTWGTVYKHAYQSPYDTEMSVDPVTGGMNYTIDDEGKPVPVMSNKAFMNLKIYTVKPGMTTDRLDFSPFDQKDKLQVVRLFPWPKTIPGSWVLDEHHKEVKAKITLFDKSGEKISRKNADGGDVILLDDTKTSVDIGSFEIQNVSEKNHTLMFFVVEVEKSMVGEISDDSVTGMPGVLDGKSVASLEFAFVSDDDSSVLKTARDLLLRAEFLSTSQ